MGLGWQNDTAERTALKEKIEIYCEEWGEDFRAATVS